MNLIQMIELCNSSNEEDLNSDKIYCHKWLLRIEKLDYLSRESYNYFVENYLNPNKPCMFTSKITYCWKSRRKWVKPDGSPNLEYLINKFGCSIVPVVICDNKLNASCKREDMVFKTYIEQNMTIDNKSKIDKYFYLKDWHLNRAHPDYKAYITPKYFCDDWLNEFCEKENDDFQFVYIGPKGSWTPLHADVYGSYSWSANICGRKRWLLFPPGQEKLLEKKFNNLPIMLLEKEISNCNDISYLDIIQEPGEIIFVPSGWYHQVWNLENTISINHNWFNGYNIEYVWNCLSNAASDVEQELSDLKQFDDWWNEHQILLKAHHGMNSYDFFKILEFIYESRISSLISDEKLSESQEFDLLTIKHVCKKVIGASLPKDLIKKVTILFEKINMSLLGSK